MFDHENNVYFKGRFNLKDEIKAVGSNIVAMIVKVTFSVDFHEPLYEIRYINDLDEIIYTSVSQWEIEEIN